MNLAHNIMRQRLEAPIDNGGNRIPPMLSREEPGATISGCGAPSRLDFTAWTRRNGPYMFVLNWSLSAVEGAVARGSSRCYA